MSPWFSGRLHGSLADIDNKKWRQKINPAAAGLPGKEEFCRIFAACEKGGDKRSVMALSGRSNLAKKGFKCIDFSKPMRSFESRRKQFGRLEYIIEKNKKPLLGRQQPGSIFLDFVKDNRDIGQT